MHETFDKTNSKFVRIVLKAVASKKKIAANLLRINFT